MTLQLLLGNSFYLVFMAFAAMAFFLIIEKDSVLPRFRTIMSVSATYIAIAAVCYWYMKDQFASLPVGQNFPTHFRYIDWILTTPLMLIKFPMLLGLGTKGRAFMIKLVGLDFLMIATGYIGEINPTSPLLHNGLFALGCFSWICILWLMFSALAQLPAHLGESVKVGVKRMSFFMFLGWAIYPAGYFAPQMGLPSEVRELIYNVADFFNKLGLCLLIYITAKQAESEETEISDSSLSQGSRPSPVGSVNASSGFVTPVPAGGFQVPPAPMPPSGGFQVPPMSR